MAHSGGQVAIEGEPGRSFREVVMASTRKDRESFSSRPTTTTWNWRDHGPLPQMLLGLTVITGLVDSVSILELGRVFVANMTGNIVFVGFALAGASGFSLSASLFALMGFLLGAAVGGLLIGRVVDDRAVLLLAGAALELALVASALGVVTSAGSLDTPERDAVAALLATAMGIQNAVARRLAVPDLTTTVLTMTLTGIAADLRSGDRGRVLVRRLLVVGTMFGGAVAGAEFVLHGHTAVALGLVVGLLTVVSLGALLVANRPAGWRSAP
jgi:uncharacterized membrane protein YoaK (UPF0700 family)